ncbi:DUF6702 family protein [Roseivirga sp. BDSF3-8]|uniref:DUF6702 family protein n=1 Tax=Roseivirga sp. BDSF3-8 TaxID=3241598 RepID=UPI0035326D4A
MSYNMNRQSIEVSQRMFSDDLEKGIRSAYGISFDILEASQAERDTLIMRYINDNFHLKKNKKRLTIRYLGSEFEEEALWAYFEIPASDTENLSLRNTLLFNEFDDQQNLVHIDRQKDLRSYIFRRSDKEQVIFR